MLQLHTLPSLLKKRKRVGRGGKRGGTSCRGSKGQKARTGAGGKIRSGFEGGQMPLYRRLPKRGFNNALFRTVFECVSINRLAELFHDGQEVTKELLIQKRIIKSRDADAYRLKILGGASLAKKLIVHADAFSQSAKDAIQAAGGVAHLIRER